ncbi:MAG: ribonuclease J, partial [Actinomycetales bacterium]
PDGVVVDRIDAAPPEKMVLMSTGSQGEPMAALSRIANRSHPQVSLEPGDTVLLASSLIPGNENAVYRVIDGLTKLGARVVHKGNALVHVSGHASAGELLYCYNIVKPTNVLPVHGEIRHLHANAALATQTGVPNVLLAEDGYVVDLVDGHASVVGAVECGYVYVDGSSVGEITDSELKDRRILRDEGFISVVVVVDSTNGKIVTGPEVHARGLAEDDSVFDEITPKIVDAVEQALREGTHDTQQLQQVVRRVLGSFAGRKLRRRPMIIPIVLEA